VGAFCLVSGILSLLAFTLGSDPVRFSQLGLFDLGAMALAGLGPMGAAFYLWDYALKHGDPRRIGALSYLTPLLSTLNLALFAGRSLTVTAIIAMGLIITGAVVGTRSEA
jgi:drug/metabolite transporter (DMT)-like permease